MTTTNEETTLGQRVEIPAEAQETLMKLYNEVARANAAVEASEAMLSLYRARQSFVEFLMATKASLGLSAMEFWDIEEDGSAFVKIGQIPAGAFIDAENGEVSPEAHQPVARDQVIDARPNCVDPGDVSGA